MRATSGAGLLIVGQRPYSASLGLHKGPVTHAVLHHATSMSKAGGKGRAAVDALLGPVPD
ncbi:hypothetical protein [Streptomyces sp. NPDC001415]